MTKRAILLVEDNPSEAQLMCEALAAADAGITVALAVDVGQAWSLLSCAGDVDLPALVVTDHHLPDATGQELIARLRSDPARARVPVVMLSGDADRPADLAATTWYPKPDTWAGWCSLARELAKRVTS